MLTHMEPEHAWIRLPTNSRGRETCRATHAFRREQKWREPQRDAGTATEDITISRWTDLRNTSRREDAITPHDRYFIGVALKTTRLKLTRGRQTIFEGTMPEGTLYVGAPSTQLSAQFDAPCDFLHLHIPTCDFRSPQQAEQMPPGQGLQDLVLLRDTFAGQLVKALIEHDDTADEIFVRCISQTLAMHVTRLELRRTKVNALPKWRLRRVEDYVREHLDRCISLSDFARVAGLSRMHFAAQFRAATGYRPREYLLHQRIERAKSLLAGTDTPLAEAALAVGFCTQAHFSTVFKRITGESPARWRCARRNEPPSTQTRHYGSISQRQTPEQWRASGLT